LHIKDPLASRFIQLRESGLSIDEAWKVIAVETLADAGLIESELLEKEGVDAEPQTVHIPILESKLIKTIRIEPADDDRIIALVAQAEREAALSKKDAPSESSIIRQALRLGMEELERRNARR
jgi:hypothetical protein